LSWCTPIGEKQYGTDLRLGQPRPQRLAELPRERRPLGAHAVAVRTTTTTVRTPTPTTTTVARGSGGGGARLAQQHGGGGQQLLHHAQRGVPHLRW
jgi:hypothetical protein